MIYNCINYISGRIVQIIMVDIIVCVCMYVCMYSMYILYSAYLF